MERRTLDEAANWFARLRDPKVLPGEREEFARWLLVSPSHIREYLSVVRAWGDMGEIGTSYTISDLVKAARHEAATANVVSLNVPRRAEAPARLEAAPPRRQFLRYAAAAALGSVALISAVYGWQHLNGERAHYSTQVGEQRSITLGDGSVVFLNTDSQISIRMTEHERRIALTRGEARFTVAKDPTRPFTVTTPHADVRALGTVFNVQIGTRSTAVAVLEGRIEVRGNAKTDGLLSFGSANLDDLERSANRIVLQTGEQAAVTPAGKILPNAGPPMDRVKAWPDGRLIFRQETLGELIEEFNRYHTAPITVADPTIADFRVSGTFGAYDRGSLLAYLAQFEEVRIEEAADGSVRLIRRPVTEATQ